MDTNNQNPKNTINPKNQKMFGIVLTIVGIIVNLIGALIPNGALLALQGILIACIGISTLAKAKGKNHKKWAILGFLCPIIVFPILLCLKDEIASEISQGQAYTSNTTGQSTAAPAQFNIPKEDSDLRKEE